jgi:hypothetical protein
MLHSSNLIPTSLEVPILAQLRHVRAGVAWWNQSDYDASAILYGNFFVKHPSYNWVCRFWSQGFETAPSHRYIVQIRWSNLSNSRSVTAQIETPNNYAAVSIGKTRNALGEILLVVPPAQIVRSCQPSYTQNAASRQAVQRDILSPL